MPKKHAAHAAAKSADTANETPLRRALRLAAPDYVATLDADNERLAPARMLIGYDAPRELLEDVSGSLKACFRDGGTSPDCEGRALIFAKNRGWYKTMAGWEKRAERTLTFAEGVSRDDFNSERFVAPKVEFVREGPWPIGENEDGELVYADFTRDLILAFRDGTNELHDRLKPMATLGHISDESARQLPNGGLAGRFSVEEITEGDDVGKLRLVAPVSSIPAAVAMAIENKGLNRISIDGELNYYDPISKKTFPAVIKRFALLGGTTPRITGMEDLPQLYREDSTLEWDEKPVRSRIVSLPTGYSMDGHRIAAAEGAAPFSFRRIALDEEKTGGEEEVDMTKDELKAFLKEEMPAIVKAELAAAKSAETPAKTEETAETVTAAEGKKPKAETEQKPAIAAAEVATLTAQLAEMTTKLGSMQTQLAEQGAARVAELASRNTADDDAVFRELPKGLLAPFEVQLLKAVMAEGRSTGRTISLGEGQPSFTNVRDLVVHYVKQRKAAGLSAITMAEKGRVTKDGALALTGDGNDAFKRMKIDPDDAAKRVAKVGSGGSFFTISRERAEQLGV